MSSNNGGCINLIYVLLVAPMLLFALGKGCICCADELFKNTNNVNNSKSSSFTHDSNWKYEHSKQQLAPKMEVNNNHSTSQPRFRTEYYDEKCIKCNGSGTINCMYCNGRGYVIEKCLKCKGKGSIYVEKNKYNFLHDEWETFESYDICISCFGKGGKEIRCTHCRQFDYLDVISTSSYMVCPNCHGQGILHRSRQVQY